MVRTTTSSVLYKRSANNKIEQWSCTIVDNPTLKEAVITYTFGEFGGKLQTKETFVTKGKNLGKANATDYYRQAQLDVESDWNKKKNREGYKQVEDCGFYKDDRYNGVYYKIVDGIVQNDVNYTIEQILEHLPAIGVISADFRLPMKAYPMRDKKGKCKIDFPCYGQPKLNGIRSMMEEIEGKVVLQSKTGKQYNVQHILDGIQALQNKEQILTLDGVKLRPDGELYIHGQPLQEIVSAVLTPSLMSIQVKFYYYDLAIDEVPQSKRIAMMEKLDESWELEPAGLVRVKTVRIDSEEEAEAFTDLCIKEGYEGAIFRKPDALYQFGKRTYNMVKNKRTMDAEFIILDVIDSDNAPGLAMFVLQNDLNDETFTVTPTGTHAERAKMFNDRNNLLGKQVTATFFERTADKIPFHVTSVVVRDYE
jgi:DNA ligase 1